MVLRFRRRIKLLPGIWIYIGKTGISTSIGTPGATVNIKGKRVRATAGIPGTGLSYTADLNSRRMPAQVDAQVEPPKRTGPIGWLLWGIAFVALLFLVVAAMGSITG